MLLTDGLPWLCHGVQLDVISPFATHVLGSRANGYQPLPDFPEVAPDPSVRVVEVASPIARASMGIVKTVAGEILAW